GDPFGVQGLDSLDAERVLDRDRREHRQRMAAHARQRQDIGLQAGAAARVGGGEGQHDRRVRGSLLGGWVHRPCVGCGAMRQGPAGTARARPRRATRGALSACELGRIESYSNRPSAMKKYMCLICGHIYDEALGDPDTGVAPGTKWEDVPPNWTCPDCGARKEDYELVEF